MRAKDLAILRVDRDYNIGRPNWAKAPNIETDITKDQLILKYKEVNGKLYLNYFLWNLKGAVFDSKSGKKITNFERNEELNIHNISLEKTKKSLTMWDEDIYKLVLPYDEKFWREYPVSNTQLFVEVKKELEERQGLSEQFQLSDEKYTTYNPKNTYKVKELKEDFLLFRKSLEEGHPALYRYTAESDFSQQFDSTYRSLSKPLTDLEFYRLITPLIAQINCGHTEGRLSEDYYKFYDHREFYFPLQTKFVDGRLFVLNDNFTNDSVVLGSEIMSINGDSIENIKTTLDKHLSSDGYIQTSKDQLFGRSFSQLYSLYYGKMDEFLTQIKTPEGQVSYLTLPGTSLSKYLSKLEKPRNANRFKKIDPGTALLEVKSFTDSEGVDFQIWAENTFKKISEDSIQNLVIDLRDNKGGRDDYALYLYSLIASGPFSYHSYLESAVNTYSFLQYTDQDNSFNELMRDIVKKDSSGRYILNSTHPTLGIHQTNSPTYDGKVIFLINGNTFSAAADFAAVAQHNKRGIFIGEETGGTAIGNTSNGELILTLPNTGIRIKIPLFKIVNAIQTEMEGRGVLPDYETKYSLQDILMERDNELELALTLIEGNTSEK